ncbi:OmpA family protein [Kaistella sp. G5-32]|uniref:OmpA family protein n=1 Tax=Kaistella gelatinilytica TaxID=2787636 RepID=A0ABS0FF01_9FLAO|nr:OmpA family protein [Kaistella gelatinilytica]MBF8458252.1 OmpA family protein [Kaistella gelatinilytica]
MKLGLFLALAFPIAFYAQDRSGVTGKNEYPNAYSSGSAKVSPFTNSSRLFKDWSISVGGGAAVFQNADLSSFYDGKINLGWNGYASIDKQITHTFGISVLYQMGKLNQKAMLPGAAGIAAGVATAWTKYQQISILGDINFSNLIRRVDNHSPYRWALHGYAGVGLQGYNTLLLDNDMSRYSTVPKRIPIEIDQKLGFDTFFYQIGTGVKYNASKLIDIEARAMYIITGDDSFDGGGYGKNAVPRYNAITSGHSDNFVTVNLGLSFKLGKHDTHLAWYDPMQDINSRINVLENTTDDFVVCQKGDKDNDGVCDDWDRQLDTPAGARVDGAGVALDMDLDGVIDLYDKCVTVPGPVENNGCPINTPPTNK